MFALFTGYKLFLMFFKLNYVSSLDKRENLMQRLQRLFLIALFGAIIFVANMLLPPPLNYLMIVVQAVLLALSALFIPKAGAMHVGVAGGLLTLQLVSPALGLFTFCFAFLYGLYVDVFLYIFKIRGSLKVLTKIG